MNEYDKLVEEYLGNLINEKLRKNLPGLYATLSLFTYSKFSKYPGELLYSNPYEFIKLMKWHLSDETIATRIIKYLLEDLRNKGEEGEEALASLLNGEYGKFRKLIKKVVKKEAIKWSRKLIS